MSFTMDSWQRRREEDHWDQVAMGLHNEQCEWRPGGFNLCHCKKRARIAAGVTVLPEITFMLPTCNGCWAEVHHDGDSFYCPRCNCRWGTNASDGDQAVDWTDDYGDLAADLAKWEKLHSPRAGEEGAETK